MHNENMSDTLYHFTGYRVMGDSELSEQEKDEKCYEKLLAVLKSGYIAARDYNNNLQFKVGSIEVSYNKGGHLMNGDFGGFLFKGNITCYCEIPLASCGRHCKKYGKFGVGFGIDYMATYGANVINLRNFPINII